MKTFPFNMYHVKYGTITAASDSDVENAVRNGFEYEPPEKTNSAFIRERIAILTGEIAKLQENLILIEQRESQRPKLAVEESVREVVVDIPESETVTEVTDDTNEG